jgi:putative cell wall-binding protein/Tol biopolymer transport system component
MRLVGTRRLGLTTALVVAVLGAMLAGAVPAGAATIRKLAVIPEGGNLVDYQVTPDSSAVVFTAAVPGGGQDLFAVGIDSGEPVPLTANPVGATIGQVLVTPDSGRVLFTLSVPGSGTQLYSVPLAGGTPVRLNTELPAGREVAGDVVVAADGVTAVYRAEQRGPGGYDLFARRVDATQPEVPLHPALPEGSSVQGFEVTETGARVVYTVATVTRTDLFSVPTVGQGTQPPQLNDAVNDHTVTDFAITPNSGRVLYVAEQGPASIPRLHSVVTTGGQPPLLLSAEAQQVAAFHITPDSQRVVYRVVRDDAGAELWGVGVTAASRVQLNVAHSGEGVREAIRITPGSTHVVYEIDRGGHDRSEVFSVPTAGPAAANVLLHPELPAGNLDSSGVQLLDMSFDGRVLMLVTIDDSDPANDGLFDQTPLGPAAAATRVNAPLAAGRQVYGGTYTPDGRGIVYEADHDAESLRELYAAPVQGPAPAEPVRVTGASAFPTGTTDSYRHSPDSRWVVYAATHDASGRLELYASDVAQPTPPPPTDVIATPGDRALAVGWTRPPGGSAVTGYRVVAQPLDPAGAGAGASAYAQATPVEVTVDGSATAALLSGLRNGTAYSVTVHAANQAGEGPASVAATATPSPTRGVVRLSGANRILTAVEVSKASFNPGVPVAFVATAGQFPDALAGGPAADLAGGPILLTPTAALADETRQELERLQPGRIVVLGGAAAVADVVVEQLRPLTTGAVTRLSGPDRFATAGAIAQTFEAPAAVAYVATGGNFPDALAGGAAAARTRSPILLTRGDRLPDPTRTQLERLQPGRIVVLGGTAAVSDAVMNELRAFTTGTVTRLAGPDRFATAGQVAATFPTASTVFVATGANFPDALAGTPAAGLATAPIILVERQRIPAAADTQLARLRPTRIVILGGTSAVSLDVQAVLGNYLAD